MPTCLNLSPAYKRFLWALILFQRRAGPSMNAMVVSIFFSLMFLFSKDAVAALSLFQPSFDSAQVNSSLLPNGTLKPAPKEPFRLENLYAYPPVAVNFAGYGDSIPQGTADVCVYKALDHALNTSSHSLLTPIDARDLDYTNAKVSMNFHPSGVVIWEEWKNALYLLLKFVDDFDTREFFFTMQIRGGLGWVGVGKGYLITF